ncbi:MAG: hypothetical protein Q7U14_05900, partial [Lacisediminimonas sp.]|nr:hypothetical protein [Lacisediminimonas sp.]
MAVLAAAGAKGSRQGIDDDAADFTDGHTVHDATDHFAALTRGKADFKLHPVVFVPRQAANDGRVRAGQQSLAGLQDILARNHYLDQLETRMGAPKSGRMFAYKRHGMAMVRGFHSRKSQNGKNA